MESVRHSIGTDITESGLPADHGTGAKSTQRHGSMRRRRVPYAFTGPETPPSTSGSDRATLESKGDERSTRSRRRHKHHRRHASKSGSESGRTHRSSSDSRTERYRRRHAREAGVDKPQFGRRQEEPRTPARSATLSASARSSREFTIPPKEYPRIVVVGEEESDTETRTRTTAERMRHTDIVAGFESQIEQVVNEIELVEKSLRNLQQQKDAIPAPITEPRDGMSEEIRAELNRSRQQQLNRANQSIHEHREKIIELRSKQGALYAEMNAANADYSLGHPEDSRIPAMLGNTTPKAPARKEIHQFKVVQMWEDFTKDPVGLKIVKIFFCWILVFAALADAIGWFTGTTIRTSATTALRSVELKDTVVNFVVDLVEDPVLEDAILTKLDFIAKYAGKKVSAIVVGLVRNTETFDALEDLLTNLLLSEKVQNSLSSTITAQQDAISSVIAGLEEPALKLGTSILSHEELNLLLSGFISKIITDTGTSTKDAAKGYAAAYVPERVKGAARTAQAAYNLGARRTAGVVGGMARQKAHQLASSFVGGLASRARGAASHLPFVGNRFAATDEQNNKD